jgi:hypothetical protein
MNRLVTWMVALACTGVVSAARAQIEISWKLVHDRTVLMEPVLATVRIANYTGRELDLSPQGNARLRFDVEDQPTSMVRETGHPLVRKPVLIPHGETREVQVDLLDAYRIIKGQSYMLTPIFDVGGMRFSGRRLSLEVQPGLELMLRNYGMPFQGDARTVSLRLIHRERSDRLFFRIDNSATGYCLGVYELGRVIRFFVPRLEQDREGVFHVLHQSAPDRFVHARFDYEGRPRGMGFYAGEVGSLRLVRNEAGEVEVLGGTPYEEDPDQPGILIAPALPPSNPYSVQIGEMPVKGRSSSKEAPRNRKAR